MLDRIRIGVSRLTDRVYIGTTTKRDPSVWSSKVDATGQFIGAIMDWVPPGTIRMVVDNHGNEYEIEVRKVAQIKEQP